MENSATSDSMKMEEDERNSKMLFQKTLNYYCRVEDCRVLLEEDDDRNSAEVKLEEE